MGYDGASAGIRKVACAKDEGSCSHAPQREHDGTWEMNLRSNEAMQSGPFPERPGEKDCAYFVRTGLCRFGMTCKFNHPVNRNLAVAAARMKGEYPERIGQPECQYYLRTGTCKFGATCKFDHPKDKAGIAGRAQLNSLGYPLRPNERECSYYLRTGHCKFGNTCKFHHPQPSNAMASFCGSPICPSVHSPTTPGQQSFSGVTDQPLSRTSCPPSPRWQGPSSYAQVLLPQGVVQVPGWSAYPGQLGSVSSSENQQQTPGKSQVYGCSQQNNSTNAGSQGSFSPYHADSCLMRMYALERDNIFPERPDEPECVFYMKTGDCKYGPTCRFHHPKERLFPVPDCVLNPLGLPLRPGEPLCIFYSRYGICKYGPNCKFDHPMGALMYGLSAPGTGAPVRRTAASRSGAAASPPSSEETAREDEGKSRGVAGPEPPRMSTGDDKIDSDDPRVDSPACSFPRSR